MKNNKGFTLTELLAIIVLISVFGIIAGPNLTEQIKSSEEEEKNILSQNIENASMIYAAKYHASDLINQIDFSFTLKDLQDDGLIELKGKCSEVKEEKIYVSGGSYVYDNIKVADCYSTKKE